MCALQKVFLRLLILVQGLVCAVANDKVLFNVDVENVAAKQFAHSIVDMVMNYYVIKRERTLYNFYAAVKHEKRMQFFGDIMDYAMQPIYENISVRVGVGEPLLGDDDRHFSVLLIDSMESLRLLFTEFFTYHLHLNGYFIIVLHNFTPHYYDDLFRVFELNWQLGVINANVLVYAVPNLILLFGIQPFTAYHCRGLSPAIANKYIKNCWQHDNFFPDKLDNLYGCPFTFASWPAMPYFDAVLDYKRKGNTSYIGIDGKLLNYLGRQMNFTPVYRRLKAEEIKQVERNESVWFNKLFAEGVDFFIGSFRYKPTTREDPYSPTLTYYSSDYYFVISSRAALYNSFTKLLLPFSCATWACTLTFLLLTAMLTILRKQLRHRLHKRRQSALRKIPLYNVFVSALGGVVTRIPAFNWERSIFAMWLCLTLVLRASYQAYMYHYVKLNISLPLPTTVQGMLEHDYDVYASYTTVLALRDIPVLHASTQLLNDTEMRSFDMLRSHRKPAAIITPFEYFGYMKRMRDHVNDFYVVPQKIFTQPLCIYMRSNSILLWRFNKIILKYSNVGFMTKWADVFFDVDLHDRDGDDNEEPVAMHFYQLRGAIYLLLVGYVLAVLVLLAEVIKCELLDVWKARQRPLT